ncbi:MAG: epoxyqueuosine reductase QueH [Nitrospirae bacterium]|nr:epoxyqueuosine reductase QueH [Nitrospirota bacterium]
MKLLMHICCANCATYPVSVLKEKGITLKGLWFNPNIHPYMEYKNRLDAVRKLGQLWDLDIEYRDYYGLEEYLRNVVGNKAARCEYCYSVRLEETAIKAREINADAFSTTLLVSPYQKFDMILEMGRMIQEKHDVEFHAEDFRSGYSEGRRMAKTMDLYRQQYCGCIYSEMERYQKDGSEAKSGGFAAHR